MKKLFFLFVMMFWVLSCEEDPKAALFIQPTITLDEVVIDSYSANLSYTLTGNIKIKEGGFYYGTDETLSNSIKISGTENKEGKVLANVQGIEANTTYYYNAYATDGKNEIKSETISFHTPSCIAAIGTAEITNITNSTATSGGTINKTGGLEVTAKGVCWGTSENPTIELTTKTSDGAGSEAFTSSITGLIEGTTYYVRAYATNSVGTAYGEQKQFKSLAILPTVITSPVTNITFNSATAGGEISYDGGGEITERGVCYSTSVNPTVSSPKTSNGTGSGNFTSNLTPLNPGTLYYYRAYATNSAGTAYGEIFSFTTNTTTPTVITLAVTEPSINGAIAGGTIASNGGKEIISSGLCWSLEDNPTIADAHTTDGSHSGNFTSKMTGWLPGKAYCYRAYATNENGTSYGETKYYTYSRMWIERTPYTAPLDFESSDFIAFSIGDKCYVMIEEYGWDIGPYPMALYMYDPETDVWSRKSSFPGYYAMGGVCFTIGTNAYYGTGLYSTNSGSTYHSEFYKYDSLTDTWSKIANFPGHSRWGATAFSAAGKGYVLTGFYNYGATQTLYSDMYIYNPTTNSWTSGSPFPTGNVYIASAFSIGEYGYVGGGYLSGTGNVNKIYRYNTTGNYWTSVSNPNGVDILCFALNGKGYGSYWDQNDYIYEYNPSTLTWTNIGASPTYRPNRNDLWAATDKYAIMFHISENKICAYQYIP